MKTGLELNILSYKYGFLRRKFNMIKVWGIILVVMKSTNYEEILC